MKIIVKVFVVCVLSVCFCILLYAQASPKASVSEKKNLSTKHNLSRSSQKLQIPLLQGVWSDDSENNAIFIIEGKHVSFFDHIGDVKNEKEYRTYWSVSNNKLSFHYSGGLVVTDNIVKLTKDSLVLYRKDIGTSRYVRLK